MSITRAFTTRRVKQSLEAADDARMQRSNTTRLQSNLKSSAGTVRYKISAPVELIHTTNMLSYNAPDIHPRTASSTSSSSKSDDESDAHTNASTPPTSPDVPSVPENPAPRGNHLSSYFTPPREKVVEKPAPAKVEAPAIPQRSPSHTKKTYDVASWGHASPSRLSEQSSRSASTKASSTFSRSSSTSTSTSVASRSSASPSHMPKMSTSSVSVPPTPAVTAPPTPSIPTSPQLHQHRKDFSASQHPFGQELAQVSELAEEFGSSKNANAGAALTAIEEEEQELLSRGLLKFSADDYLSEIKGLAGIIFGDARQMAAMWI